MQPRSGCRWCGAAVVELCKWLFTLENSGRSKKAIITKQLAASWKINKFYHLYISENRSALLIIPARALGIYRKRAGARTPERCVVTRVLYPGTKDKYLNSPLDSRHRTVITNFHYFFLFSFFFTKLHTSHFWICPTIYKKLQSGIVSFFILSWCVTTYELFGQ